MILLFISLLAYIFGFIAIIRIQHELADNRKESISIEKKLYTKDEITRKIPANYFKRPYQLLYWIVFPLSILIGFSLVCWYLLDKLLN